MKNPLVRVALLAAICCILRLGALVLPLPNVTLITALFFALALELSLRESLVVMAVTMVVTAFIFGFGLWVAEQILVYALVIGIFWLLAKVAQNIWLQALLAGLLAFIFSFLMDAVNVLFYGWGMLLAGLPFDGLHALSTLIAFPILLLILQRVRSVLMGREKRKSSF